ncbi:Aldehyde-activating protein [Paramixta manurensis]|uniref:Aldehyde-activating protein n=1 Tax=Paramixta manurensis TaxID=2740817 RepID=A0A6M8UKR9_9GAMM|nr:Aldehyde-activating protein [Erwiniaceae bacterium PD-1]
MEMYIGEGFAGDGVNASHINIMLGPRNGVVGQAFANSLASPSQGHSPFMVVIKPNVPAKPMTLYVNKAEIKGELHGNATWGASQAAIASAVTAAQLAGILPEEAEDEWCIITANWVNPACTDLDEVYRNNYRACHDAIQAAMEKQPGRSQLQQALKQPGNPFYTPKV